MTKRRIKKNVWGNWNGYEGTKKVVEFGIREEEAQYWLENGQTLSESYKQNGGHTMKTQHTPGPWTFEEIKADGGNIVNILGDADRVLIFSGRDYNRTLVADSRLIAAAPEMLGAMKEALCWLDPDCKLDGAKKTEDTSDRENIIIDLYQIIARAEGKE